MTARAEQLREADTSTQEDAAPLAVVKRHPQLLNQYRAAAYVLDKLPLVTPTTVRVLVELGERHSSWIGWARPKEIAIWARTSPDQCKRALRRLRALGVLSTVERVAPGELLPAGPDGRRYRVSATRECVVYRVEHRRVFDLAGEVRKGVCVDPEKGSVQPPSNGVCVDPEKGSVQPPPLLTGSRNVEERPGPLQGPGGAPPHAATLARLDSSRQRQKEAPASRGEDPGPRVTLGTKGSRSPNQQRTLRAEERPRVKESTARAEIPDAAIELSDEERVQFAEMETFVAQLGRGPRR